MRAQSTLFGALLFSVVTGPVALADSGVICHDDCTPHLVSGAEPTRTDTMVSTWQFTIENCNLVCNEDTKVSVKGFMNDPVADSNQLGKQGHAEMKGIYKAGGSPSGSSVEWNFEDESTQNMRFDVETGEDEDGCDFQGFDVTVVVCDTGGGCDIFPDGPCENPTAYHHTIQVRPDELATSPGTATLVGHVTKTVLNKVVGVEATLFVVKTSACVMGDVDNLTPYAEAQIHSDPAWKPTAGDYSLGDLPAGAYKVVARVDGSTQSQNVTINNGSTVTVNFAF